MRLRERFEGLEMTEPAKLDMSERQAARWKGWVDEGYMDPNHVTESKSHLFLDGETRPVCGSANAERYNWHRDAGTEDCQRCRAWAEKHEDEIREY